MLRYKKYSVYIGIIIFFCMFLFAANFYFERLNSDSGHYFFKCYNSGSFRIEHSRYVLAISQVLPVMASWLNLPVKAAAWLYSINHVLFFLSIWSIVLFRYKNHSAALMVLLIQFIGLRESVYTPQFELYYGLGLLVLWYALITHGLESKKQPLVYQFLGAIILFLCFTSHPFAAVVFLFVASYLVLQYRIKMVLPGIFICTVAATYLILKSFYTSDYETGKIHQFFYAFDDGILKQFLRSDIYKKGFTLLIKNYFDVLMIFCVVTLLLIRAKKYSQSAIYLASFVIMTMIIWVMFYPNGTDRYLEQVYFPLGFLCLLPLLKLKNISNKIYLGVLLIFAYRAYIILNTSSIYKNRTAVMKTLIERARLTNNGSKFYVTENELGTDMYAAANWGFGFETLILSTFDGKSHISITKDEDLDYNNNKAIIKPEEYLYSEWEIIKIKDLKKGKFILTTGDYQLLDTDVKTLFHK